MADRPYSFTTLFVAAPAGSGEPVTETFEVEDGVEYVNSFYDSVNNRWQILFGRSYPIDGDEEVHTDLASFISSLHLEAEDTD